MTQCDVCISLQAEASAFVMGYNVLQSNAAPTHCTKISSCCFSNIAGNLNIKLTVLTLPIGQLFLFGPVKQHMGCHRVYSNKSAGF
jgi:hypothetical protein